MKYTRLIILIISLFITLPAGAQEDLKLPDSVDAIVARTPPEIRDSLLTMLGQKYYENDWYNHYPIAFKCFLDALTYAQKYKHDDYIPYCYFHMGSVYDALQNPEAVKYYTLHYNSVVAMKLPRGTIAYSASTLASVYSRMLQKDSTVKYLKVMQDFADNIDKTKKDGAGNVVWQQVYVQMAYAMLTMNDDKGMDYYYNKLPDTAAFYKENLPYDRFFAEVKSKHLLLAGDRVNFLKPLTDQLAKGRDSMELVRRIIELLARNEQYKEAYQYWRWYHVNDDTYLTGVYRNLQYQLLTAEKEEKEKINQLLRHEQQRLKQRDLLLFIISLVLAIAFLFVFFAYRRFKRQNRLLNEQNIKISEQSENIQSLIKEIHHRVKNNLQIISSLIDLQQIKTAMNLTMWLREIQSKMRTIALAHQMIYEQENTASIMLQDYFTTMTGEVLNTLLGENKVFYNIDMGNVQMGIDDLVPLAIIINEALVNTVKHAIPQKADTAIAITAKRVDEAVVITYADSGPGLPDGVDATKSKSLGIRLIKKLAAQLGAEMTVSNIPGVQLQYMFVMGDKK